MSQFAPITNSSIVQHSSQLHPNSTFQTVIENLQQQMSVLSTQFAHLTSRSSQSLRTELRLLFQDDNENTLDYFERLKTLMTEIDPECSDHWLKHKFIQKLRSDIRTRLDVDINLPIRDIVRKSQNI
ncbi:unnamed protein product, partial [Rotaria magnacalcarata]